MTKIVFFGTQEFGANILDTLIAAKNFEIAAVVTQPDRPVGRKQELQSSPVKILATKHSLSVLQPEKLKNFTDLPSADFFIVCQYGLIIPQVILDLPKNRCINVHTSLLPKYRGASPIQSALINGETTTGITIMYMDAKMDTGQILSQEKINIAPDDTYLTLFKKMEPVAEALLIQTLQKLSTNQITPTTQDESQATFCKLLERADGEIKFSEQTAQQIYNLYRGTFPWPGIFTTVQGKRLKILKLKLSNKTLPTGKIYFEGNQIFVGAKTGAVEITELQPEGKKPMLAPAFINGYKNLNGTQLPS